MKDNDYYNSKESQRQSLYPNLGVLNMGKSIREKNWQKILFMCPIKQMSVLKKKSSIEGVEKGAYVFYIETYLKQHSNIRK